METTTELRTEITIMKVFEYMLANNCNRKAACKALEISYPTFNRKLAENPTLLSELLKRQKETVSLNLSQLMIAQQELLRGILKDASNPDLSISEKIVLNKHLADLQEKYARDLGVETDQEKSARSFLTGAKLRASKAKVIETTKTTELIIENDIPPDIIEGTTIEETN